ncbi:hypothetical protein DTO006G1_9771 [Penicillium roqueforti]|nr:hypothetical protein CBS147337_9542 [Penicillium roqueforti]KAI2669978.1 hypothetical protein CBS147355_9566 [Penicillium roqueforti]KAI2671917.1 hypothetical protein LCP963914a_9548 [Penicillium roqueforti]KAI2695253.1 hypothetical protein CBS147372_9257 [Penicillium roqueforti]KAI2708736.1 hypothetical protein CBS147318_9444 [Penicillium roqueforti]
MLAGKGVRAISVLWAMTLLSFILVLLRLYIRVHIVKALVFLLVYTVFLTIAGVHGFGQSIDTLEMDSAVKAVYNEMIGKTFAILGMAIAKISLGTFLLCIVIKRWHRISIWTSMISLSIVSMMTALIFWFQRVPSRSIWDHRVPGYTVVPVTPFSVMLGCWCAAVDFYFTLLPWIFIWNLNMKFKEKMSIAISLSLGFIACICGIIRTIDLGGLASSNYTEDTVNLIIWSAVELAVTLICVGIPTVRPLYRTIVHGSHSESSEGKYVKPRYSRSDEEILVEGKTQSYVGIISLYSRDARISCSWELTRSKWEHLITDCLSPNFFIFPLSPNPLLKALYPCLFLQIQAFIHHGRHLYFNPIRLHPSFQQLR